MSEKIRINWVDQLRGIAFYTVILGHMSILYGIKSFIYSFHMPLFFMITGLVFNIEKVYNSNFKDYFTRLARKMLVPYFFLQLLSVPIRVLVSVIQKMPIDLKKWAIGILVGNNNLIEAPSNPLYYVLLLFLAQIGLWFVIKLAKGKKIFIAIILCLLSSISICSQRFNMPWHINVVPVAMLFIFIGILLMDLYLAVNKNLKTMNKWRVFAICGVLGCCGFALNRLNGRISIHGNYYGKSFLIFVLCAVVISVAIALLVMRLPNLKVLTFIGANTFFYMGIHKPILLLFEAIVGSYKNSPVFIIIGSLVCFFGLVPIAYLFKKYMPFVFGNGRRK